MTRVMRRMTDVIRLDDPPYLPTGPVRSYALRVSPGEFVRKAVGGNFRRREDRMALAIEAKNVIKQFQGAAEPALRDFSLAVPAGTLCALVGPDGAGKTTALRILATVSNSFSGSASVVGYDVRADPEAVRSRIGYMPQNFSLYPDLSVWENLLFFAELNGVPGGEREPRMRSMLEFAGLAPFRERRAGDLSGGMKKKLALACALVHDPQVLILDEPSTGVDPVSRRELWRILAGVVRRGVAALISTPYMDEAERCHRIGMLYRGKVLLLGTPEELLGGMPSRFLEVKASPRKAMRQIVTQIPGVLSWRPVGDRLRVETSGDGTQAESLRRNLERQFREQNLQVDILEEVKPMMEDLFVHMVGRQGKAP
ncbi:MAG: ABC transporter ATP-binding protein [Anaerolineales bacterium]|nr:ABC transporter ATP-binding protein [Anaerolineales bacterium]